MLKITSNCFRIFSTVDANTLWVHLFFVFLLHTLSNSLIYCLYTHSGSLHSVLSCQDFWENHSSALQRGKPAESCTTTLAEGGTQLLLEGTKSLTWHSSPKESEWLWYLPSTETQTAITVSATSSCRLLLPFLTFEPFFALCCCIPCFLEISLNTWMCNPHDCANTNISAKMPRKCHHTALSTAPYMDLTHLILSLEKSFGHRP